MTYDVRLTLYSILYSKFLRAISEQNMALNGTEKPITIVNRVQRYSYGKYSLSVCLVSINEPLIFKLLWLIVTLFPLSYKVATSFDGRGKFSCVFLFFLFVYLNEIQNCNSHCHRNRQTFRCHAFDALVVATGFVYRMIVLDRFCSL